MASVATATPRPPIVPGTSDEQQLFLRWHRDGDREAREALVRRFMPLTRSLARPTTAHLSPLTTCCRSLRSVAQGGRPLRSRARPHVPVVCRTDDPRRDAAVLPRLGWSVHVPRGAQERALKVRDAQERLANERGRAPTVNQLAEYLELDIEEIIDALQAIQAYEKRFRWTLPDRGSNRMMPSPTATRWDARTSGSSSSSWTRPSAPYWSTSLRASARSSACGSWMTSPRRRSQLESAFHRCRSRGCCGVRSISCEP